MSYALLVIDVQQGLFQTNPPPDSVERTVSRINSLSSRARQSGVPVIFIHHEAAGSVLEYESPGWELAEGLHAEPGDLRVRKTTPDSFLYTDLSSHLSALQVTTVVVCGYASEFCVDTTVRRAAAAGYDVILAADAHTTHDKAHATAGKIREHHNVTLAAIRSFGSKISALSADSVAFSAV
ncbi:cysteine hydrolase family protein [Edaphovirga cremea]|uniref:cysteine hydrolase family protein n=1 Tax=Edaphovirga cremea TaxID=2267246 RepID=UPI003988FBFF